MAQMTTMLRSCRKIPNFDVCFFSSNSWMVSMSAWRIQK